MMRPRTAHLATLTVALALIGGLTILVWAVDDQPAEALSTRADPAGTPGVVSGAAHGRVSVEDQNPGSEGQHIWGSDCAVCHGDRGEGSFKGPRLTEVGTAAVDFMVRTGRMPLSIDQTSDGLFSNSSGQDANRSEPKYDDAQIRALVDFTASFISGPEVPESIDIASADLANGGDIYRQQCAACHQMAGSGGALAYGTVGPSLHVATPVEVYEAIRTGPGSMPVFPPSILSDRDAHDVVAYVNYLKAPDDRGGFALWHLGPVPEGLVAWVVGLGLIVVMCRWLGKGATQDADAMHAAESAHDEE